MKTTELKIRIWHTELVFFQFTKIRELKMVIDIPLRQIATSKRPPFYPWKQKPGSARPHFQHTQFKLKQQNWKFVSDIPRVGVYQFTKKQRTENGNRHTAATNLATKKRPLSMKTKIRVGPKHTLDCQHAEWHRQSNYNNKTENSHLTYRCVVCQLTDSRELRIAIDIPISVQ
jgi:hypothetical protein